MVTCVCGCVCVCVCVRWVNLHKSTRRTNLLSSVDSDKIYNQHWANCLKAGSTNTNTAAHRQTDRETDRQTMPKWATHKHTHTHTHTQQVTVTPAYPSLLLTAKEPGLSQDDSAESSQRQMPWHLRGFGAGVAHTHTQTQTHTLARRYLVSNLVNQGVRMAWSTLCQRWKLKKKSSGKSENWKKKKKVRAKTPLFIQIICHSSQFFP